MASKKACDAALARALDAFDHAEDEVRGQVEDRTVSLFVPDLDLTYTGRLQAGRLHDVTTEARPPAQVRLTIASDDLVDLVEGRQRFVQAFAHGKVHIDAGLRDLLRLRSLL